jgi:hypothetical protein
MQTQTQNADIDAECRHGRQRQIRALTPMANSGCRPRRARRRRSVISPQRGRAEYDLEIRRAGRIPAGCGESVALRAERLSGGCPPGSLPRATSGRAVRRPSLCILDNQSLAALGDLAGAGHARASLQSRGLVSEFARTSFAGRVGLDAGRPESNPYADSAVTSGVSYCYYLARGERGGLEHEFITQVCVTP